MRALAQTCFSRNKFIGLLVLFLSLSCAHAGEAASAQDIDQQPPTVVVADSPSVEKLLVVIDDPRSERRRRGIPGPGYTARLAYDDDPALARSAASLAREHNLHILNEWPLKSLRVHCFLVSHPGADGARRLSADPRVRWTQPFNEFTVKTAVAGGPVDTSAADLVDEFLRSTPQPTRGIRLVVVDTGADVHHPALRGGNIRYANFVGATPAGQEDGFEELHGTAVVGVIGAQSTPGEGASDLVRGLAPRSSIHHLRGCWQASDGSGRCNTLTLARALDAAVDIRPDIVNLSLTGPHDRVLGALVEQLTNNGAVVVAAFDENRAQHARFPAPGRQVIFAYGIAQAVPGVNVGADVMWAPGQVMSLQPMSGYGLAVGHSIAAPHLSAMLARLMAQHPKASPQQIISMLKTWLGRFFSA